MKSGVVWAVMFEQNGSSQRHAVRHGRLAGAARWTTAKVTTECGIHRRLRRKAQKLPGVQTCPACAARMEAKP
jgi:hypothetical protein